MTAWVLALLPVAAQAAAAVVPGGESFLRPLQQRDSVLIGDQLRYGVLLKDVAEGTQLAFPRLSPGDSVLVLTPWQFDTLRVTGGRKAPRKRFDLEASVVLTSFDGGDYRLPPLQVARLLPDGGTDTLTFDPKLLQVKEIPIDTATFQPHDLKGQVRYPLTLAEVLPWVLLAHGVALLAILAVCLYLQRRRRAAGAEAVREAPHITALRKLDGFRGNRYWAPDKQKFFYSGVTDTLREYMAARYGIGALEMTTAEIFDVLRDKDVPAGLYDEMKDLFVRSDFVKFAKLTASDEENAQVVPAAVRFVTGTYQAQLDAESQDGGETPEKEEES